MQGLEQRPRPCCANLLPLLRWSAADLFLNGIQSCDSFQSLAGDGQGVRLLQVVELAPNVRPTSDFLNAAILFIELIESSIGVCLQPALKLPQMPLRMFALAIRGVREPNRRGRGVTRRAIIPHLSPQSSCLGLAMPGASTGTGVSSAWSLLAVIT